MLENGGGIMPMWLIVIIVVIVLLGIFVMSSYNSLVRSRNRVRDQFSQIDIQLKRRADLIPNLVETVKGYAKHEKGTLEDVIKARNTYLSSSSENDKIQASDKMEKAISKLFALAESYPDLKANTNFLELQKQLNETEDKISYARQFYNDSVLMYNNSVETFPTNIIASMFGFKINAFFEAKEEERQNVQVKF